MRHPVGQVFAQVYARGVGLPLDGGQTGQLCSIQGLDLEMEPSSAKPLEW